MDAAAYLSDHAAGLVDAGQVGAAIDAFHHAITLAPGDVDIRLNLCVVLRRMGWFDRMALEAETATKIAPHYARGHLIRGVAAMQMHKYDIARECFETVLTIDPDHIDGLLNLASLLSDSGNEDGADRMFRRVLDIERERPEALSGLATLAARRMHFEAALPLYDRACAHGNNPGATATARWNRALALLTVGRMSEAWGDFEARLQLDGGSSVPARRFRQRQMFMVPREPKRIHVHYEQGFGDIIQFSRYVPMLADRGNHVSFEVPAEMVRLFRASFEGVNVVERAADYPGSYGLPEFDEHAPLMSLMRSFGTDIDSIPSNGPYLRADERDVAEWSDRLELTCPPRRIGLCWSGQSREDLWCSELDRRRSLRLKDIVEAIPFEHGDSLVSLQLGPGRYQIADVPGVADFGKHLRDWADTAALIANLDVVVSVDTAVGHLAGAMGKRVIMLDRFDHCWRWSDGNSTAWYPTDFTILRQHRMGDWSGPIAALTGELMR